MHRWIGTAPITTRQVKIYAKIEKSASRPPSLLTRAVLISVQESGAEEMPNPISRRQQKKMRRQKRTGGIHGLKSVPLGAPSSGVPGKKIPDRDGCFAIDGTVAHLKCRMLMPWQMPSPQLQCLGNAENSRDWAKIEVSCRQQVEQSSSLTGLASSPLLLLDGDHYLIMGQVVDAYCKISHWDSSKNLFRPMNRDAQPYMTFFGSQTFGYVQP